MLANLRKSTTKIVTLILFSLLILSFAVFGIGDIFRGVGRDTAVVEVGDVQISHRDFARNLSREIARLQPMFGGRLGIAEAQSLGIVDQVLQQMINRALFEQQGEAMRMVVSSDQIRNRIIKEPAFLNDAGVFDRAVFEQILLSSGLSEDQYVAALRQDIVRAQIVDAATGAGAAPVPLAKALYAYNEERRSAETLLIRNDSITDLPTPDEESLKAFHEDSADSFMAPQTRSITLVQLRVAEFAQGISMSDEVLQTEYEARREELIVAERRSLQQIVFEDEARAAEAKAALDQGGDFASTAEEMTQQAPVDIGTLSRDELEAQLPELAEPVFSLGQGEITAPIESPLGWHLVQVSAIEPRSEPGFEEARDQLAKDLATSQAVDSIISVANQLDDELAAGSSLEDAAAALSLKVMRIRAIDETGKDASGTTIDGLPPPEEFLALAFQTPIGDESLLTETVDGDYYILRVDGVTPAKLRPLEEVRDEVIARWSESERELLARQKAEDLAKRAAEVQDLTEIGAAENLPFEAWGPVTRTGEGSDNAVSGSLIAALFEMKLRDVKTARAADGTYVVKLTDIETSDPAANRDDMATVRENLTQSLENDLLAQFATALRQEYDISVNPALLDQVLSAF